MCKGERAEEEKRRKSGREKDDNNKEYENEQDDQVFDILKYFLLFIITSWRFNRVIIKIFYKLTLVKNRLLVCLL